MRQKESITCSKVTDDLVEHTVLSTLFSSLLGKYRSEMPRSYTKYVFKFWGKYQRVLQSACSIYVPMAAYEFPLSTSLSTLVWQEGFYILATLTSMLWSLAVVLVCIFLPTNDTEHLFIYFCYFYISWLIYMCKSFAHFKNWVVCYYWVLRIFIVYEVLY